MGPSLWQQFLRWVRTGGPGKHRGRRGRVPRRRTRLLSLEALEDRSLLSAGHGAAVDGLSQGHVADELSSQPGQTAVVSPPATPEESSPPGTAGAAGGVVVSPVP